MDKTDEIYNFFHSRLQPLKDDEKAPDMKAYMKDVEDFLGIQRPERMTVYKEFKKEYGPYTRNEMTNEEYRGVLKQLWDTPFREYKYTASFFMEYVKKFIHFDNIDLFQEMIITGAWWDTTDTIAQNVIGKVLDDEPNMKQIIRDWVGHDDLWIRRTTIISQNRLKEKTDTDILDFVITSLMKEDEFFIQKAIGWALREYSKTNREWSKNFIELHKDNLSSLAIREGSKYL